MVGYWPFDGNALDKSGNGHHGTPDSVSLVTGRFGQAYDFQNSGSIQTEETKLSLGETYTLASWMWGIGFGTDQAIFSYSPPSSSVQLGFRLFFDPSPSLRLHFGASGVLSTYLDHPGPFSVESWTHVAAVADNGDRRIYINGQPVVEDSYTGSHLDITGILTLGVDSEADRYHFNGYLDDMIIFDRALSNEDITLLASDNDTNDQADFWQPDAQPTPTPTPTPTPAAAWEFVSPLNVGRQVHGAALGDDGFVYAVGGNGPLLSVERYDPATDIWTLVAPLNRPRQFLSVVKTGGLIYAIGGRDGSEALGSMETYDVTEDTWTLSAYTLNVPRCQFAATVDHDGKIYAIAGNDSENTHLSSVEVFDPANPTVGWQLLGHELNESRNLLGAGTDQIGRVYAIAGIAGPVGFGETVSVERFDPANPSAGWVYGPSLNQRRQVGAHATAGDGTIYVLGGWDGGGGGHLSTVEVYDFASDRWLVHSNMNRSINNFAAAFDRDGRLYAIGGEHFNTQDDVERIQTTVPTPSPTPTPTPTPQPPAENELRIRSLIDGRTQLVVRGDELHWHHLDYAAPGLHGLVNEPTFVNQRRWIPQWPEQGGNCFCDCDSSSFDFSPPGPALPLRELMVELEIISGRGGIQVIQQPDPTNDFTLVVGFDDNAWGGPDWYEAVMRWMTDPTPSPSPTPTPAPTPDLLFEDDFNGPAGERPDAGRWEIISLTGTPPVQLDGNGNLSISADLPPVSWLNPTLRSTFGFTPDGSGDFQVDWLFSFIPANPTLAWVGLSADSTDRSLDRGFMISPTGTPETGALRLITNPEGAGLSTGGFGALADATFATQRPLGLRMVLRADGRLDWFMDLHDGAGFVRVSATEEDPGFGAPPTPSDLARLRSHDLGGRHTYQLNVSANICCGAPGPFLLDRAAVGFAAAVPVPPVEVLAPNGGETWLAGSDASIHWRTDVPVAGTGVRFELRDGPAKVAELGFGWHPDGEEINLVRVPQVPRDSNYVIRVVSTWRPELLDESDAPITITRALRDLPPIYVPEAPLSVSVKFAPDPATQSWAAEDVPPAGWMVGDVGEGGVFDAVNGKVKWGPFFDARVRTLTYEVTPPPAAIGLQCFNGTVSFDGASDPIDGDACVQACSFHSADAGRDWRLTIEEMTAYAAAWQRGDHDLIDHVTNAGLIWRSGECYTCDPNVLGPDRWQPCAAPAPARSSDKRTAPSPGNLPTGEPSDAEREMPSIYQPGVPHPVGLNISPAPGALAWAVEETPPAGWLVGEINEGGVWDALSAKVKWGPFFDPAPRTLTYQATPPLGAGGPQSFHGTLSADGQNHPITGPQTASDGTGAVDWLYYQ